MRQRITIKAMKDIDRGQSIEHESTHLKHDQMLHSRREYSNMKLPKRETEHTNYD